MEVRRLWISLVFILALFSICEAQEAGNQPDYKKCNYVYWGLGWGGQKSARNFGFVSQITNNSAIAVTVQRTWLTDLVPGSIIMSSVSTVEQTTSGALSVLYGRIVKRNWGHYIFMAGPSWVAATRYDYNPFGSTGETSNSPGIALQAGVLPSKEFIGLSGNLFANINGAFTYAGVTIGVALGKVNYKIENN